MFGIDQNKSEKLFSVTVLFIFFSYISASFYDELCKFVSSIGWDLIFGLNMLLRKPNGVWEPSNAKELIGYTVRSRYKIGGWELGNG